MICFDGCNGDEESVADSARPYSSHLPCRQGLRILCKGHLRGGCLLPILPPRPPRGHEALGQAAPGETPEALHGEGVGLGVPFIGGADQGLSWADASCPDIMAVTPQMTSRDCGGRAPPNDFYGSDAQRGPGALGAQESTPSRLATQMAPIPLSFYARKGLFVEFPQTSHVTLSAGHGLQKLVLGQVVGCVARMCMQQSAIVPRRTCRPAQHPACFPGTAPAFSDESRRPTLGQLRPSPSPPPPSPTWSAPRSADASSMVRSSSLPRPALAKGSIMGRCRRAFCCTAHLRLAPPPLPLLLLLLRRLMLRLVRAWGKYHSGYASHRGEYLVLWRKWGGRPFWGRAC